MILGIGAAFVVPRLIQWGDYRPRLESMASHAFGTEVAIEGDIHLTLLPQPQLQFSKVRVGPAVAPVLTVETVAADFSLFDFLRDQYKVTRLELDQPVVSLAVGKDGQVIAGLTLVKDAGESSVSIADADVVDGTIGLTDARSGETQQLSGVNGKLRLDALDGPFAFQGNVAISGVGYGVRVSTGKLDSATNSTTLSLAVHQTEGGFALESKGTLTGGATPRFAGDVSYRLPPPRPKEGETPDLARGDFVLEGKVEATTDKLLLTEYTALPDENRSSTRLTGAAEIALGAAPTFKAVVSGGVVALPPRDATKELTDPPYELVRILGELPALPVPPIPGSLGLDINELNLRAVSLRALRLDAATDGQSWTIGDATATLPGPTTLHLSGALTADGERPRFAGKLSLASNRLDVLAGLWRKQPPDNPLFGVTGALSGTVTLSGDTLAVADGKLSLNGLDQSFAAEIGFGQPRRLKLVAHVTSIGAEESAALGALLPEIGANGSFGATFPKGELDLSASAATLFGLAGADLAAKANWEGGVVEFSELSAGDVGGAAFDAKLTAFGTLLKPELSGVAKLRIADNAPVVDSLLARLATPPAVVEFLRRSLPADLDLQLDAPLGDGGQTLKVDGQLGTAKTTLTATLSQGIARALTAPLKASLDLTSESPQLMTRQLGLGDVPVLDPKTPLHLNVAIDGVPANSYATHVALDGGDDSLVFDGNVVPGDFTRISGNGTLIAALSDPSVLVGLLGGEGVYVPALKGTAKLRFDGLDSVGLSEIAAGDVTGTLAMTHRGAVPSFSGALHLPTFDPLALWPALAGPASTIGEAGIWPSGPVDIGAIARSSEGRIDVAVDNLTHAGGLTLSNAQFGFDWDAQNVHLRNLVGTVGGGTATLDATLCCANSSASKELNGRATLDGVDLAAVLPGAIGTVLSGKISGSAAFDGSGTSLAEMVAASSGSGSYNLANLSIAGFAPTVFAQAATVPDLIDVTPEDLTQTVTTQLAAGPFTAPAATGTFTLVGGTLRSPNLAIAGDGAQIFGGVSLALPTLGLDGRYAMTSTGADAPTAFDPAVADVAAAISGTLPAPVVTFDVSALVDNLKITASEAELAILEQRRAEAEARAKAEAEEKAKKDAEAAAAAAAKKAADDEAARKAAEAAKKAAQPSAPVDLGL